MNREVLLDRLPHSVQGVALLFHFPLVKGHVNSHLFHLYLVGLPTGYRTVDGLSTLFPRQSPQFTHTAPAPA